MEENTEKNIGREIARKQKIMDDFEKEFCDDSQEAIAAWVSYWFDWPTG